MDSNKELDAFDLSVKSVDHERRILGLEEDMKQIKPIVFDTQHSVKQIEKSVNKILENSEQNKRQIINTTIGFLVTGILTLIVIGAISYLKQ